MPQVAVLRRLGWGSGSLEPQFNKSADSHRNDTSTDWRSRGQVSDFVCKDCVLAGSDMISCTDHMRMQDNLARRIRPDHREQPLGEMQRPAVLESFS